MEYHIENESHCCNWIIRWGFELEPFVKDGESMGVGRFVGIRDGEVIVQLWFAGEAFKIEHSRGYAVQVDPASRTISILKTIEDE